MIFLLLLILLTGPSGQPLYVAPEQVIGVTGSNLGGPSSRTQIITTSGSLYVRELPEDVAKKIAQGRERD